MDAIKEFLTYGALASGVIYVLGGYIVIAHLRMLGIQEYQVLKTKYLAVGLEFLIISSLLVYTAWDWVNFSYNQYGSSDDKILGVDKLLIFINIY